MLVSQNIIHKKKESFIPFIKISCKLNINTREEKSE